MKLPVFVASLALNGLLAAILISVKLQESKSPDVIRDGHGERGVAGAPEASAKPFHWDQIEAPDFARFVDNLRAIGCPEKTIRSIVGAELEQVYDDQRRELERRLLSASSTSELPAAMEKLDAERRSVLEAVMAIDPAQHSVANHSERKAVLTQDSAPITSSNASAAGDSVTELPVQSAATLVPAAFVVGNDPSQPSAAGADQLSTVPSDPGLDPVTAQLIGGMREEFARSVAPSASGGTGEAYRLSWMNAQRSSDERFSSMFGGDAFVRTQLRAVQEAAAAAAPSK